MNQPDNPISSNVQRRTEMENLQKTFFKKKKKNDGEYFCNAQRSGH